MICCRGKYADVDAISASPMIVSGTLFSTFLIWTDMPGPRVRFPLPAHHVIGVGHGGGFGRLTRRPFRNFAFTEGILPVPMLIDCSRDPGEPIPLFHQFHELRRGEELNPVLRRVAERLEQFGCDEDRHVMNLAAEQRCAGLECRR
jgi:hypothetical protein